MQQIKQLVAGGTKQETPELLIVLVFDLCLMKNMYHDAGELQVSGNCENYT
uniref:Uncharacterized protein n=1 Tax=Arion vulgaris TaxID=1028688 RepID=A0A0B7ALK3_9EUPU